MAHRRLTRQQQERIQQAQEQRRQRATGRAARTGEALAAGPLGPEQAGLVIANYGANVIVEATDGTLIRCALRQHLGLTVCGDRVIWQAAGADKGVISAVAERRSLLSRPDHGGRLKPLAANLDQVAVIVAPQPPLSELLIDRYLVALAAVPVAPLLVVNKTDLLDTAALAALTERLALYPRLGYPLLFTSSRDAHGLDTLRATLCQRTSLLVGQSGVGKSSLIKALLPHRDIRIRALSAATGHGTHTTTTTTLYHLPEGGDLIDSPGVRGFEPGERSPRALEQGFAEFAPYLGHCRFADCRHTVEPGCALLAAVANGQIDPRRWQSYRHLRDSAR